MSELDYKILNILINSPGDLRSFSSSYKNVDLLSNGFKKFGKYLVNYYNIYQSCPTLNSLCESSAKGNISVEELISYHWEEISNYETDKKEYNFFFKKLEDRKKLELISSLKESLDSADLENDEADVNEIVSSLTKQYSEIASVSGKKAYEIVNIRDSTERWYNNFKAKQQNPKIARGVLTGFSIYDHFTNGMKKTQLIIIGGATGSGKSIFLLNVAVNAWLGDNRFPSSLDELKQAIKENSWQEGNDVLFFSLEMGEEELENRILSNLCSIDSLDIDKGSVSTDEAKRLALALKFRQLYPFNFDIADIPRGCTMEQVRSIYDYVSIKNGRKPKLVIIDYLGIMGANANEDDPDWEVLKDISQDMHEFCRQEDIPVLTGLQLTTTEPGKGGIGLHRIGRSRMIAHNANLYLQIEDREDEDQRSDAKIHNIKHRGGPKFVMNNLKKEFRFSRFVDMGYNKTNLQDVGKFGEDLTELNNFLEEETKEDSL